MPVFVVLCTHMNSSKRSIALTSAQSSSSDDARKDACVTASIGAAHASNRYFGYFYFFFFYAFTAAGGTSM